MYYKEGDWESVLFPCLSVRLAIVFFLLFHISDDNPAEQSKHLPLLYINLSKDFISATINSITFTKVTIICHLKKFRKKKSLCVIFLFNYIYQIQKS